LGVFTSIDGGNSWLRDDNNFANTPVTQLVLDRSAGVTNLVAFTYGRGVWKTAVAGSGTPCSYTVGQPGPIVANGADIAVKVDTADGCTWSVTPISSYLFARSPAVGTGAGNAMIYGSWNVATSTRTGTMVVGPKTITVTQSAATVVSGNDDTPATVASLPYLGYLDSRKDTGSTPDPVHSCTKSADYKTVWWTFTAPASGTVVAEAQGRRYDTYGSSGVVLTAYDTSRTAANEVACSVYPRNTTSWTSAVSEFAVTKGKVYLVEISATGDTANDGGQTILSLKMK
jgi:hypothetical protein